MSYLYIYVSDNDDIQWQLCLEFLRDTMNQTFSSANAWKKLTREMLTSSIVIVNIHIKGIHQ